MRFSVLATARSFCLTPGPHLDFLREHGCHLVMYPPDHPLTSAELGPLLRGHDGVILGLDTCDAAALDHADRLRVISRYGAGLDNVDVAAASRRGIAVTNTPGANRIGVAELTIGLLFALARNLPAVASAAREGRWLRSQGWELTGKTLGIIGFGAIGREVADRACGLHMRVLVHDPYWTGPTDPAEPVDLDRLLGEADIVTLHLPLTDKTRHLFDAARLSRMRQGAFLINTARGGLVDEAALYDALQSGHLGGAAADVFEHDPPSSSPLLKLDNFIATPHIGATTRESVECTAMQAARNLVAVLQGEPCAAIVNADALQRRSP